jgi:anaerobic magnesium-protoporphyrin IX monomethyl ester cyclase
MSLKTLLSIPPDYDHNFPPLGTPALCAYLKANGVDCSQVDMNLGYRDFLASHLSGAVRLTREEERFFIAPAVRKFFSEKLKGRYYSSILKQDTDDLSRHLPYDNNTNSSFHFCERLLSSEHLFRYLEDAKENTFLQFYMKCGILDRLEKDGIGLFGISVISPTQAIASLTLGFLVKKHLPHIHVTLGGQWVTLYRDAIRARPDLLRCFDSIIPFEGEEALLALAKNICHCEEPLSFLPGDEAIIPIETQPLVRLLRWDSRKQHPPRNDTGILAPAPSDEPRATNNVDIHALPCPDFDGLPLRDYNGCSDGRISLTYETSRGCYWGKCAYCVDLPLPKPSYRRKDPKLVARDMRQLSEKYGAEYLMFGDPGLSPRHMREISEAIIEDGVKMEWWTMARLDPGFTPQLFELARKAGLKQINFGFESANDRVCKMLDKGNFRDRSSRIIKDCANAGIRVDLQTIFGMPNETFEDGLDTVDFLVSHKDYIYEVTFNTYYLTPFNHIYNDPEKYGIEYDKNKAGPFAFFIPFTNKRGMDKDQAEVLKKMYSSLSVIARSDLPRAESRGATKQSVNIEDSYVDLTLNGETSRLSYTRNRENEVYEFHST